MKLLNKDVTLFQRISFLKGVLGLAFILVVIGTGLFLYNPFEKARLARDQQRIRDLDNLKIAIDTYLKNNHQEKIEMCAGCRLEKTVFATGEVGFEGSFVPKVSAGSAVNITGWIPIDFSLNAKIGETPIKKLALDAVNMAPYVYTYTPGKAGSYKLSAALESAQNDGLEKDDGGIRDDRYEVGTNLTLPP